MIDVLCAHMGPWEATTLAYHERKKDAYADVWTEWDEATNTWNVMARSR